MEIKNFGAQLLTMPEIFADNYFVIPDYQRGYAWDEKQVQDLLQDLDHLIDDGISQKHYTGTLVLSHEGRPDRFNVVDGQQRLTTLVILAKAIFDELPKNEKSRIEGLYIRRGKLGSAEHVLTLNSDTRRFFENVILDDRPKSSEPSRLESHDRLVKAWKIIRKWVQKRIKSKTAIEKILLTLESDMGFIVFAPKEDAETGVMFEVINNRGKDLSELEKIKNYLIYCSVKLDAAKLRENIDSDWSDILNYLHAANKTADSDENSFLRYCMAVHFGLSKTDSQHGYIELKKLLVLDQAIRTDDSRNAAVKAIMSFVEFLKNASHWYARLYGQVHQGLSAELVQVLDQIRGQDRQASIMPLFLALVVKNHALDGNLERLLRLLETLNFRVYIARNMTSRNDSGQAELFRYASAYYHDRLIENLDVSAEIEGVDSEDKALEIQLLEFIFWNAPESEFLGSFMLREGEMDDFYQWNGLRYFLMNYEQHLQPNKTIRIDRILKARKEGKSNDYLSIEHLWATRNRAEEGQNVRPVDKHERRRLGNFVLLELRLNIQGDCDDLEAKSTRYLEGLNGEAGTDLQHVKEAVSAAQKSIKKRQDKKRLKNFYLELYREINDRNEARYKKFAAQRWSLAQYLGYNEIKAAYEEDEE
ncbi:DUF262 domain-containing protein [Altererythrobacter confluentis]|uniref:DUF262 domain-containing protein n=1 Tax=Allopontixanthobacter confluentis TaxID=1849021 RepID=A0A6L7GK61_9SPHN|nr:DUF262 domain-containing protein [Allopontixanthobacter confluentis]MXP15694.1 DUF262 domain-containing protein [Allopontixanthobacter confluentis]